MQVDLPPKLPSSGAYENINTAIDKKFRKRLSLTDNQSYFSSHSKIIIDIMTRHVHLPTLLITVKSSFLLSYTIHKTTELLGMTIRHATTKHAQTIEVLEKMHLIMKTSLKISSGENPKQWHKDLPLAILNYNTTYHTNIVCEPSRIFQG